MSLGGIFKKVVEDTENGLSGKVDLSKFSVRKYMYLKFI